MGFAAAVSPMLLTEQTALLTGADGRRTATRFLLGGVAVLVVYVGALLLWGRVVALPRRPHLSDRMDRAPCCSASLRSSGPDDHTRHSPHGLVEQ